MLYLRWLLAKSAATCVGLGWIVPPLASLPELRRHLDLVEMLKAIKAAGGVVMALPENPGETCQCANCVERREQAEFHKRQAEMN